MFFLNNKKILFVLVIFCYGIFCYGKKNNYQEFTLDIKGLVPFPLYNAGEFKEIDSQSIDLEENHIFSTFRFYLNYQSINYQDGFFRLLYNTFGFYGDKVSKKRFALGLELGYSVDNHSILKYYEESDFDIWDTYYTYSRFKAGLVMDLQNGLFWGGGAVALSSLIFYLLKIRGQLFPTYYMVDEDISDDVSPHYYSNRKKNHYSDEYYMENFYVPLAIMGGLMSTFSLLSSFISIPVLDFFEKAGFKFQTVSGASYDMQNYNSQYSNKKDKYFMGFYYGLKLGWYISLGKYVDFILKMSLLRYHFIHDKDYLDFHSQDYKNTHWSMPLEIGFRF